MAFPTGHGAPKFTNLKLCSKGSDLAFACYYRPGPSNSAFSHSFPPIPYAHRYFTSQVFVILDLNGRSSFAPTDQRRVLIKFYSGETISASQPSTSLFASSGEGLAYRFLNTPSTTQAAETAMITMTIASTRLYRSLINIYSSDM